MNNLVKTAMFLILLSVSGIASAKTIHVFLTAEHDGQIKNLDFAIRSGDDVIFNFVDRLEQIEDELTEKNSDVLNSAFEEAMKGMSKADIKKLSSDEITELVSKKLKSSEFQQSVAKMSKRLSGPVLKQRITEASEYVRRAQELKVDLKSLPVVVVDKQHFNNVFDYEVVLKVTHAQ